MAARSAASASKSPCARQRSYAAMTPLVSLVSDEARHSSSGIKSTMAADVEKRIR
jgi:hypothetical protein